MPERYEVEAVPASEIKPGDEVLVPRGRRVVSGVVAVARDAFITPGWRHIRLTSGAVVECALGVPVFVVAARGGTEDELADAARELLAQTTGFGGLERGSWLTVDHRNAIFAARKRLDAALAARAASTPEEER